MTLEALLAYAHLLSILALVVFLASEAALCRNEWMNAQVVERLVKVDIAFAAAAAAVLATGVLRTWLGVKGTGWYWTNPLLHTKLTLFLIVGLVSIKPTITFIRWRRALRDTGALPAPGQVRMARRLLIVEAHLVALIPLAAVFLARGFGK